MRQGERCHRQMMADQLVRQRLRTAVEVRHVGHRGRSALVSVSDCVWLLLLLLNWAARAKALVVRIAGILCAG